MKTVRKKCMNCFVRDRKCPVMVGLEFMNLQNSKILPQINTLKVALSLLQQLMLRRYQLIGIV